MATYQDIKNNQKTYATDEAGMLADAKAYAKRDFHIIEETLKLAEIEYDRAKMAGHLTEVKLGQIKNARLERDTLFD